MKLSIIYKAICAAACLAGIFVLANQAPAQGYDRIEKGRMSSILSIVKSEVKKNYYDPTFHGIDLDARFKLAEQKLSAATSTPQALAIIAQVLIDFNDSHLFLSPPSTNLAVEYGWRMQAIGDKCYITLVRPGSDAEAKGLKPGDQVLSVSGFRPTRSELWKVLYYYNAISKRNKLVLNVLSPGQDAPRELEINAQMKNLPQAITFQTYFRAFDDFHNEENDKHRFQTVGGITIWKMPGFDFDPNQVDELMSSRVRGGGSLILDLRGNSGGFVKTLESLTSNMFDKDVKIADVKGRKPMDPIFAKTRGKTAFQGKVVVLIDSGSASASEIFARVVQLEKRGQVLGDVSAGAVMQSRGFEEQMGTDSIVPFGISITMADVIMSDGASLEHVGVKPDELILPTGADLAAGRDPVLARAVEILGGKISAEDAGKFFKYYWKTTF